ncbi:flagellar basal body rod protein FlgB [Buchnera aphidicola]|uniref:Flagellar basal body rod protein FlgB n=1 Tax=Buchnera aphidicola (Lipaphis pseudobrassicae) TaxID=1258543 RepID=A0A4D6Y0M8_9GAMM|nr:flagellar basal body rod protein FlgB [Buchnera aphidicola]QCI22199.1 flagellar basal body rod protein FlgB [Buchnera aphidicola (Lipaphis pseudobrassicae)]
MFSKINEMFDFHQKLLNIYSKRQEILASNISNADTPGYKSVDINFNDEFRKIIKNDFNKENITLRKTSPNHLNGNNKNISSPKIISMMTDQEKPDGNTVNMDRERIEFLNNSLKYQSDLSFIKHEIKNIVRIIQG